MSGVASRPWLCLAGKSHGKNIARSQNAALNTCHRLSRCQMFLQKYLLKLYQKLSFVRIFVWSEIIFLIGPNLSFWLFFFIFFSSLSLSFASELSFSKRFTTGSLSTDSYFNTQIFLFCLSQKKTLKHNLITKWDRLMAYLCWHFLALSGMNDWLWSLCWRQLLQLTQSTKDV